jgi:hypothetical protein
MALYALVFALFCATPFLDARITFFRIFFTGVLTIYILVRNSKRFHPLILTLSAYVVLQGIIYYSFPKYFFSFLAPVGEAAYGAYVFGSLVWVLLCGAAFFSAKDSDIKLLAKSFKYLIGIEMMAMTVYQMTTGHFIGAMNNPAQDGCLLLCMYPIALIREKAPWHIHASVGAFILATGSSTALAYWGLMMGMWFILSAPVLNFRSRVALSAFGCMSVAFVGHMALGSELLNSNGRFNLWQKLYFYWNHIGTYRLVGTGLGTFSLYGQGIQLQGMIPGTMMDVFPWAHNEFLQIGFELGLIGLLLTILVYGLMILRGVSLYRKGDPRTDSWLLIAVVIFGGTSLTQMNLRFPATTLVLLFLLTLTMRRDEKICPLS